MLKAIFFIIFLKNATKRVPQGLRERVLFRLQGLGLAFLENNITAITKTARFILAFRPCDFKTLIKPHM
jgi:hypothetical protein